MIREIGIFNFLATSRSTKMSGLEIPQESIEEWKNKGLNVHRFTQLSAQLRISPPVTIGQSVVGVAVEIDKYSYISDYSFIGQRTSIGKYCSIANNCSVGCHGHPMNWLTTSPWIGSKDTREKFGIEWPADEHTILHHDVWVGACSFIKAGVTIGHGAIIAGGAVVVKDVPPFAIVAGVPATVMRYRFDQSIIEKLLVLRWWDRDKAVIDQLPINDIKACIEILESE